MRKRITSLLIAAALALTMSVMVPGSVFAACVAGSPGTYYVQFAEDISGGGDKLTFCVQTQGGGQSNLANIAHSQAGTCNTVAGKIGDDWNDCISSVKVVFNTSGTDRCVVLYEDAGYSDFMRQYWELQNYGWNNLTGDLNDTLSSVRFGVWTGAACDAIP